MIRANGNRRGFTLVELLVVVGMIALIMGAMTTSISSAQQRARVQKATSDVKVISQAILAYENYSSNGQLKEMKDADAGRDSLDFLFGNGSTRSGQQLPTLLMAALQGGGKILDPWGHPYKVSITKRQGQSYVDYNYKSLNAGSFLPNWYRVNNGERKVIWAEN